MTDAQSLPRDPDGSSAQDTARNETRFAPIEAPWLRMGPLVFFPIGFAAQASAAFRQESAAHHRAIIDALQQP